MGLGSSITATAKAKMASIDVGALLFKFMKILFGFLILLFLYKKLLKPFFQGLGLGQKTEDLSLATGGMKLSYDDATYKKFADYLYACMKGAGTEENGIFQTFGYLHNDRDFIHLSLAFGIRDSNNMVDWLHGDLSASDISMLNDQLADKGMKKRV